MFCTISFSLCDKTRWTRRYETSREVKHCGNRRVGSCVDGLESGSVGAHRLPMDERRRDSEAGRLKSRKETVKINIVKCFHSKKYEIQFVDTIIMATLLHDNQSLIQNYIYFSLVYNRVEKIRNGIP